MHAADTDKPQSCRQARLLEITTSADAAARQATRSRRRQLHRKRQGPADGGQEENAAEAENCGARSERRHLRADAREEDRRGEAHHCEEHHCKQVVVAALICSSRLFGMSRRGRLEAVGLT